MNTETPKIESCYINTNDFWKDNKTGFGMPTNTWLWDSTVTTTINTDKEEKPVSDRRLVKVIIVDPDENVKLEDAMLYNSNEQFTDLTDQELFFEIDIKALLAAHNDKRMMTVDKDKSKDETVYLEPIRIRDLKMVVLNIAKF